VSVRQPFETADTTISHLLLPYRSSPPGIGASRKIHDTIICKELDDGIEVMSVECFKEPF
jgi:hypothetical protein